MANVAMMFPGQGSQEVGMGADLFESSDFFRSLVVAGSDMVGADLRHVCLHGSQRELAQARFLQPLLCAVSLGYHRELVERGVEPAVLLGHSLGETTSLGAAGVVTPEDAIRIAAKRGLLMDEAAARVAGGMMAVLFMGLDDVHDLLRVLGEPERIVLANDNAPEQVVVSGDNEALDRFAALVAERQRGKCKRLNVVGPWHSPYMEPAREAFDRWVGQIAFAEPRIPVIFNALCREERDPTAIRQIVTRQLTSPVYWRQSMLRLGQLGVEVLLEIGPGRVLAGLARVNGFRRGVEVLNVGDRRGVERAVGAIRAPAKAAGLAP